MQEESHMDRKIAIFLLLSLFCAALLLPQEWQSTDSRWTDKNNTEKYAAYLLSEAYAEHGYYGAKVEIKQAGTKRLFMVDPGQIFHVKDVVVTGLQTFSEEKIVQDAPKTGEIYSDARTNEWIQGLVKRYVEQDGPLKLVNWGAKYDHAHAQVTIQSTLQERR
jgi:outer membrane protein assembly factor BamA